MTFPGTLMLFIFRVEYSLYSSFLEFIIARQHALACRTRYCYTISVRLSVM